MSTPSSVNEETGLLESWHGHFKVPIVHQQAVEKLNFGTHRVAVHTLSGDAGRLLDFYAQLGSSDELFVSLHGAAPRGSFRYPMFRRVESMRYRVESLLCFADPTLTCSEAEDFTIGWYVGGSKWDPLDDIESAVRAAQEHTGARYVAFLGGSAGGHAALRIGTRFPGSLALVTDPQTDVGRYYVPHRDRMLRYCWNGSEDALARHPERFDMNHLYTMLDPENYIYYRQSTGGLVAREGPCAPV